MKTLVLCRHAKSDWPVGTEDIERPLKNRGVKDAHYLGELLNFHGFRPDLIVSSPAKRAHSTARILASQMGYSETKISVEPLIYYEDADSLLNFCRTFPPEIESAMLIGHNPTMESAVRQVLQMGAAFNMPTCAMVCLETYVSDWSQLDPRNVYLRWVLIPRFKRKDE